MSLAVIVPNYLQATKPMADYTRFLSALSNNYDGAAINRGDQWVEQLQRLQLAPVEEQLTEVNRFFNRNIIWQSDTEIYGLDDFWATPTETMGLGKGDCEDFTIAKYVSLRQLGVPSDQLRLTYVKLQMTGGGSQAHMVLAWYEKPGATPLILDNANPYVLPASKRRDLRPVFSFTSDALWVGNSTQSANVNPSSRLSQWRQMLLRAQAEGITL
jgi:predicted transglutaminase-like cysteine proteinase